jgi:GT2 family glycosyltransferase
VDLERCLGSILQNPPRTTHEIVVVDNASSDGSAEAAAAFAPVRVIRSPRNAGFAAANNVGIRASQGSLLLLLNSDTVVPEGAIDALVGRLRQTPEAAVAGPRLVDGEGRAELSFGKMISPLNEWRQQRVMRALARGDAAALRKVEALTRRGQWPDWVSGACLLVRREDAEAVGLLDERFFMYTEDVDFCASIRARGRRVLFAPDVQIVHLRGRSAATAPAATRAAYERSHLAFYRKHHPVLAWALRLYRRMR